MQLHASNFLHRAHLHSSLTHKKTAALIQMTMMIHDTSRGHRADLVLFVAGRRKKGRSHLVEYEYSANASINKCLDTDLMQRIFANLDQEQR